MFFNIHSSYVAKRIFPRTLAHPLPALFLSIPHCFFLFSFTFINSSFPCLVLNFLSNLLSLILRGLIPQKESIGFRNCLSILHFLQLKLDLITRYFDYWDSWTTMAWSHIWLLLLKLWKRMGEQFLEGHGFHFIFTCKFYPFEQVNRVDVGHSFELK